MPRKQNGFGNAKSFGFKGGGRVDKGKGVGAFGTYPGNRRYGVSIHRTVKETWNLNGNWTKWRRGYEMYSLACFSLLRAVNPGYNPGLVEDETNPKYVLADLKSVLYQGTPYEMKTSFGGYQFPTLNSDTNTHYVAKRTLESTDTNLGTIRSVLNDELKYTEQKKNQEIWCKGEPGPSGELLLQMINERLTDGETEATLKMVLNDKDRPAVYFGKTPPDSKNLAEQEFQQTVIRMTLPIDDLEIIENKPGQYVIDQGLRTYSSELTSIDVLNDPLALVGKVIYIPNFFITKSIEALNSIEWQDGTEYFRVDVIDKESNIEAFGLDPGLTNLPPSMYDISTLPKIFIAKNASFELKGSYVFLKSQYQRFWGRQYMSAETVQGEVANYSYAVMPFIVQSAGIEGGNLVVTSAPYKSDIKLYPELTGNGTMIFSDKSFCRYEQENKGRFDYTLNPSVQPWQDEVFTSGQPLIPADVYTCDCPNYSKSIVAMPEAKNDYQTRKINRQRRYPLPTALSSNRFENLGLDAISGKITSWESSMDRESFKLCKHTVAARFIDNVKVLEPNEYPTVEARIHFEEKLEKDMAALKEFFRLSSQRGELSIAEIVFALAQGLNLDDIETAYVMLNNN